MNKNIIAEGTTMGTTTHNHKEHTTAIAPFHSAFFQSLHKEQWQEVRLGEVAEIKTDIWKVGGEQEQYVGLEHIAADSLRLCGVGNSNEVSSNKYIFKEDDILFGKLRPYFRKIIKAKFKGICSTDIWVIRAKQNINQTFLFYFFANKTLIDLSYSSSKGTRMPRADWNFLSQTTWLIPPLKVQQQIAEILSSLDDKIDLLHRQNKTLESLSLTLFRHTFIDNPKRNEWEMGKLGDYVDISSGKSLKREYFKEDGKYDILGANGIIGRSDKYLYDETLIYTGRVGTLGKIFIIDFPKKVWLSDNTLIIKPKKQYLYFIYFLSQDLKLENYDVGSTQPLIRQGDLLKIEIVKPNDKLILEFENMAKGFFDKIHNNAKQIQNLQSMRDMLLAKILNEKMEV
ncbi:restriction endonuclease subunit S [Helicobacter typhlonius]|uniref:restriction endonuclease subunit S n=1 Tax=Helicobacter typhlonius TaxID=76936 RepID=UPI002FE2D371